jgi:hypothetical protein
MANVLEFQEIDNLALDDLSVRKFFPRCFAIVEAAGERPRVKVHMTPDFDII